MVGWEQLVGILTILFVPTAIPFFHRFGRSFKKKAALALLATTVGVMVVFSFVNPYDAEHPRRMFFEHEFNATSGGYTFHAGASSFSSPPFFHLFPLFPHGRI